MGARPRRGQRFPEQEGGLEEPVGDRAYPPHDTLLPRPCSTGPAAGAGEGPAPLQNTVEVKWPRRWAPQGAKGWGPAGDCPAGITWSGCIQCRPWWRCWTMAGSCRAGCGPGGKSCVGWSRGSGLLEQNPGAGCSPWDAVKEDSNSPSLPTALEWHCQQRPKQQPAGLRADSMPFPREAKSPLSLCRVLENLHRWRASTMQNNKGQHVGTKGPSR